MRSFVLQVLHLKIQAWSGKQEIKTLNSLPISYTELQDPRRDKKNSRISYVRYSIVENISHATLRAAM